MSMTTELIERLRKSAKELEAMGFAPDGMILKDYREAADTIQLLSEKLHTLQPEPFKDCISRQAAIYAISHAQVNFNVESEIDFTNHKREVHEIIAGVLDAQEKALKDLPSVQPKSEDTKFLEYLMNMNIISPNEIEQYLFMYHSKKEK